VALVLKLLQAKNFETEISEVFTRSDFDVFLLATSVLVF